MSKAQGKHMSADGEDKFEENLEGENFGSIDDWESELGLKILKMEEKINAADAIADKKKKNTPVIEMLRRKLVTYNISLQYLSENPKSAMMIGSKGGLQAIIAYLTKQAVDEAASMETKKYSGAIMTQLPGFKMWGESAQGKKGGFADKQKEIADRFA